MTHYTIPGSPRRTKPTGCYVGREDQFQKSAIAMVRAIAHPLGVDPRAVMHIPNGSKRALHYGAFVKAQGMVAGYPDIMVFAPGYYAGRDEVDKHLDLIRGDMAVGLALELKCWPNKPSDEQMAVHEILRKAGWQVVVCYGLGEVEDAVNSYLR